MAREISPGHEALVKQLGRCSPIFKFSKDVRTVIYTTNAIESLNST